MVMTIGRYVPLVLAVTFLVVGRGLLMQDRVIKESLRNSRAPDDSPIDGDDYGLEPDSSLIPAVIIAGTQKGGTGALKFFLEGHPQMKSSGLREGHFFDEACGELCERAVSANSDKKTIEKARKKYCSRLQLPRESSEKWSEESFEHKCEEEKRLVFDKTPFYLFDPYIPKKIKTIVPWTKIIILLRDPVERAYSNFKMHHGRKYARENDGNISFETCIDHDIQKLANAGIVDDATFWEVDDEEREQRWLKYYGVHDKGKLIEENVCDNEIGRGLYFLQLSRWFKEYNTAKEKEMIYITKSDSIKPDKETHLIDMKPITQFIGIDEFEVKSNGKIHATKSYFRPMKDETKQKLMKIFDPFNKKLASLLGDDWKNPWPYTM